MDDRAMTSAAVGQDAGSVPRELASNLLAAVRELREWLAGPATPDSQVREWRLWSGIEGGIWCAEDGCGCEGHSCQIMAGGWTVADDPDSGVFTIVKLHAAVATHIAWSEDRKALEVVDS